MRSPLVSLAFVIVLAPSSALAATFTWDGGGSTNNWSEAANWNPTGVPGSTGSVVFDGTSSDDVTIDANVRIQSLTIASGYAGTITQSGAIMVGTGGYIQGGGTFHGGSASLIIQRDLTLTGGTLRSTSGILSISGSLVRTGGTFDPNDGTVSLAAAGDRTLAMASPFHDLDIESTREEGLVGYWKLDETSIPTSTCATTSSGSCPISVPSQVQSRTAVDSSGNGWNLSAPSSNWASSENWPTFSSDGAPVDFANPGSMTFYRARSWLVNTLGPTLGTSGTVSFWMKNPDITTLQVAMSNYTAGDGAFLVVINAGNWVIQTSACSMPARSASFLSDGGWHHIAFSKSPAESRCDIFVDGALVTTVSAPSSETLGKGIMIGNHSGFDLLGITGQIDDVRLYDRALSSTEIADLASGLYPVRTGGSTVTSSTHIAAVSAFNVWNGTFALAGHTLTAEGSLLISGGLSLGGGSVLSDAALSVSSVTAGASLSLAVTDPNRNLDGAARETVAVTVDDETITLTETTVSSGLFTGTIPTAHAPDVGGDGVISRTDSCSYVVQISYADPQDPTDTETSAATILDPAAPCEVASGGGGHRGSRSNERLPTSSQAAATRPSPAVHPLKRPIRPVDASRPAATRPASSGPLLRARERLNRRIQQRINRSPQAATLLRRLPERFDARLR